MYSNNLKDDASQNSKSSARAARDKTAAANDDLRDAAQNAGRTVRQFLNSATDELAHAQDAVASQIRSRPIQASLVALGIGLVLGALYRPLSRE